MRSPVFVGSAFVAQYPQGGGNSWVPMQWLLGLLEQGHDAWWLEYLWTRGDPAIDRAYIDLFWEYARRYGVADRVVLGYFPTGSKDEPDGPPEYSGMAGAYSPELTRVSLRALRFDNSAGRTAGRCG